MRNRVRAALAVGTATVVALAGLTVGRPASAATLVEVTNFGSNPTNLRMHLYVPDRVASRPAVLVAVHYCTGTGPAFYSGTQFASLADQYGFIVIYPSATRSGQCFDVSSPGALTHNGNSDPVGIVSMVRWVLQNRNGDADRVYVTGASSGAMMTNVLLATYPDVFRAGAAFMGVPHACFATTDGSSWNSQCANGQRIMTAQQWGDLVRSAYPGYNGPRPRMQVWHGTTDSTLRFPNFGEEIKQWTNVHGLNQTPSTTDTPQPGWTRTRYGGTGVQPPVEGIAIQNVGHNLPLTGQAAMAIAFLGLAGTSNPPSSPPSGCTATMTPGTVWGDRYNTTVTISGTNTWTVVVALTAPQRVSTVWSGNPTRDSTGTVMTVRPNGSGNTFGFTTMFNGNSTARPTIRSCTTT